MRHRQRHACRQNSQREFERIAVAEEEERFVPEAATLVQNNNSGRCSIEIAGTSELNYSPGAGCPFIC